MFGRLFRPLLATLLLSTGLLSAAEPTPAEIAEARYGPAFYGMHLPRTGARVLLVVDTSKSMGRKDSARTDGGRRWDTLLDEVRGMTREMRALVEESAVAFTVSVLFEGGDTPHRGSELFDLRRPEAADALATLLAAKDFTAGGSFETTFGEHLWPLVADHHITHIIYLGDNDIAKHRDPVSADLTAWYTLPKRNPTAQQRPLWRLKSAWWKPWEQWRAPKPGQPIFKHQRAYPPPPKEVTFSAVAIGQPSPFLKELATLGGGDYTERLAKKRRSRAKRKAPATEP